jgi:Na+-translocating ferredoxin:NAD+ oxidoreductase RNF subunit RnfB
MNITVLLTIVSLCSIGVTAAIILYFVAQKFKVIEDPRIDQVEEILPGANCGGCGFPGCRGFAEATVKSETLDGLFCPVGGAETMSGVAKALGKEVQEQTPKIAVLKCNGTCENRPRTNTYDGASSCAIQASLYSGQTGCQYGCLGCGDCADVCNFDALHMNENGLPVVVQDKCVACGACVDVCPKDLFELRNKGPKDRRVFVACNSKDKGGIAKKACATACIGCMKCAKECPFDAIVIENSLAYIDYEKCKLCRKCVAVCPTGAIHETNFPPRKPKPVVEEKEAKVSTKEKDTNKSDK